MKQTYFILLAATLWLGCHRQVAPTVSFPISTAPNIDGDITDWGQTLSNLNSNDDFQCFVANDKENLYIGVRLPDANMQAMAMQMGMTLWIDTVGKQQHHRGIGFPVAPSEAQWIEWANKTNNDRIAMQNMYAQNCQDFDLVGFVEEPLRVSNLTSRDMKVAAKFDPLRQLVFEVKVPIKTIMQRNWQEGGALISVHAKINEPKRTVDDDTGTFNDPNANTITQSNPLLGNANPNMMNNPNMMGGNSATRVPPNTSTPNVWLKVQLSK